MIHQLAKLIQRKAIVLIVLLAIITRFIGLNWALPYHPHPDEWNIINLSLDIGRSKPFVWTKGTFSYGSLTAYLASGYNRVYHKIITKNTIDDFNVNLIFLRIISALASVFTVYVAYRVGEWFWKPKLGLVLAFLLCFTPGLIQSAHLATFEAVLTCLYTVIFYLALLTTRTKRPKVTFLISILLLAVSMSLKINSIVLLPGIALSLMMVKKSRIIFLKKLFLTAVGLILLAGVAILLSPYYLSPQFRSMFAYERGVVTGSLDVFYTRQYIESVPIIYQFLNILPYAINPILIAISPIVLLSNFSSVVKRTLSFYRGNRKVLISINRSNILLWVFLSCLFLPNAFMFAKWSRYMCPVIPFFTIWLVNSCRSLLIKRKSFLVAMLLISFVSGLSFFYIYLQPDSRFMASKYIVENIPDNSFLLSETGNVADIPMQPVTGHKPKSYTVVNFDFYNLDFNPKLIDELVNDLVQADYILIPSRRLYGGMGRFPLKYPLLSRYYELLFSGKLGFVHVRTICPLPQLITSDLYCFPSDERAEETWSVFDHPVIRIYQKTVKLTKENYSRLFEVRSGK